MELRHLRYFVAVAEELHFGRAAERLNIAQPSLSRQIQQLEEELGVALFDRDQRRVTLTEAGREYLARVRAILAGLAEANQMVRQWANGRRGQVHIGFTSNLGYVHLPTLLTRFRDVAPDVHVRSTEMSTAQQVLALRERQLDLGLATLPVDDPSLRVRPLFTEALIAVVPSEHSLARHAAIPVEALAQEPFVMCPQYELVGFHEAILDACRHAGFTPRIAQETADKRTLVALVAAGLGISIVPASAEHAGAPGVTYRPLVPALPVLEVAAIWRTEQMTPALRALLDMAIDLFRAPLIEVAAMDARA